MKVSLKYQGQMLVANIPNPAIGQFVTLTAGDTRLSLYWDGKGFVLPQAQVVNTAQIVAAAVEDTQKAAAPRDLPDWVHESRDPRIVALREQSGPDYDAFVELRAAGAWHQALLMTQMRAERKARTGAGDDLEELTAARYASHAVSHKMPLPSQMELAELVGDWEPSGEDIKLALEFKGEEEWASALVSKEAERDDDWGFEKATWMPDPIGQLLLHGGRETIPAVPALDQAYQHLDKLAQDKYRGDVMDAAAWARAYLYQHLDAVDSDLLADILAITAKADALQAEIDAVRAAVKRLEHRFGGMLTKLELPIVLANIADQWATMTAKQLALIKEVMPETKVWDEAAKDSRTKRPVLKRRRRIFSLWNRSQMADVQDFIDEALDQWENRRAANDELAHPDGDDPKVEVALDNQTRFLNWVAQGALSATGETWDGFKADKARKSWLGRPTYLVVLDSALKAGANINQAKNCAYAADTLRLPDRVLAWTGTGFRVKLNAKGQEGVVSAEDARLAFPHLPAAAKARMKQVHGMVQ